MNSPNKREGHPVGYPSLLFPYLFPIRLKTAGNDLSEQIIQQTGQPITGFEHLLFGQRTGLIQKITPL